MLLGKRNIKHKTLLTLKPKNNANDTRVSIPRHTAG